jgi:uncharacterized protein YceK
VILLFLPRRDGSRKSRGSFLVVLFAVSTFGFVTGCGSGVSISSPGQSVTAAGAYAVTVTATAGATVQAAMIRLTVQ